MMNDAIVVPNQAVQTGQDGSFIYVVREDRTVEARPVTTTIRTGQDLVIGSGLQAGETIVTEGQLRLAPGLRIAVRQPGAEGKKKGKKKAE
jgi:multidrug efflux system membrane fusion protein